MGTRLAGLVAAVLLASALITGCGDDARPNSSARAGVPDKEYLAHLCTGLVNYRVALNSKPDPAGISAVVKEYIADMKQVAPPADLAKWHESYVKYLQDVVNEPTKGITQNPPLPPETVRQRLAGQVLDVQECKYHTFLGESRPGQ